jgi:hypothetical protein
MINSLVNTENEESPFLQGSLAYFSRKTFAELV